MVESKKALRKVVLCKLLFFLEASSFCVVNSKFKSRKNKHKQKTTSKSRTYGNNYNHSLVMRILYYARLARKKHQLLLIKICLLPKHLSQNKALVLLHQNTDTQMKDYNIYMYPFLYFIKFRREQPKSHPHDTKLDYKEKHIHEPHINQKKES